MSTIEVVQETYYRCPVCLLKQDSLLDATNCADIGRIGSDVYEALHEKVGHVVKINSTNRTSQYYILIGKVIKSESRCSSAVEVHAMDSNDYYRTSSWFVKHEWSVLTITEAVLDGWRPFSVNQFQQVGTNKRQFWNEYVEAIRSLPHDQLVEEAVQHITRRSSTWGD